MTNIDKVFIAFVWVIIGVWISYKRHWYKEIRYDPQDREMGIMMNIIFSPMMLLLTFYLQFLHKPWDND